MIRDFTRSRRVVPEAAQRGVFPGAVAAAATSRGVLWLESFGLASLPEQRKMQVDSVFDLASLTKPVATAAALLRLVDAGCISLDEPVGSFLPAWRGPRRSAVSIRHLLTHTGGLPPWYPVYTRAVGKSAVLFFLSSLELAYPPGTAVHYSCLGFILLGFIVEEVTGEGLHQACRRLVFEPLGMRSTAFLPLEHLGVPPERLVLTNLMTSRKNPRRPGRA